MYFLAYLWNYLLHVYKGAILCFELAPNLLPNMSESLNFTLLPTESDAIRVNNEIRATERQLKHLERHLKMLKAWIAPIRRLNTDILSLIFEMCGEDYWKTPLRIAATSRDWRNLVLATPRAWEFLLVRECKDIKTIKLFLERSNPLHFTCIIGMRFPCFQSLHKGSNASPSIGFTKI